VSTFIFWRVLKIAESDCFPRHFSSVRPHGTRLSLGGF